VNFFAAQDQARRSSRRLVLAYIVATIAIVLGVTALVGFAALSYSQTTYGYSTGQFLNDQASLLVATAVITTLFILGASLYKTSVLSAGGGRVATEMGGTLIPTDVQDPLRRRLRNVVEEMAIASGVPVPEIYVLEEEQGINAFAAGYSTSDAAVAVTRGTLELLDRNELQGVIAHEFSHILNGDMKLNVRLMGVLFGIMVIGLIGRLIVRGGYHASIVSSRRSRSHPAIFIVGIGFIVLGGIGVFFARAIKASVSRQREFLADASAVQFTRQSEGIANALKKIGGYSEGSRINATDPEQVSHMLFGSGARLSGMFATHPPLIQRIQALDPSFKETDFPHVDPRSHRAAPDDDSRQAAFAGDVTTAFASGGINIMSDSIAESVGKPEQQHVEFAQHLRVSIPSDLYDAAHSSQLAFLLCITLVLDRSRDKAARQFTLLQEQLGTERTQIIRRFYDQLIEADGEYRLPLLEISFPALKLRPTPELAYLVELTTRLIEVDGNIELYEFCFYRIMMSSLGQAIDPTGKRSATHARRSELRAATIDLLRIVADYGHDADSARRAAFQSAVRTLGSWAHDTAYRSDRDHTVAKLNHSLDILLGLNSKGQESLLRAISRCATYDGKLTVVEAELIRAVCATLNYPLPPILVHR
jgi:Zn-dependent protease with chaperone function